MLGDFLAEKIDGRQFCRKRRDVDPPKLREERGVVMLPEPAETVVGPDKELPVPQVGSSTLSVGAVIQKALSRSQRFSCEVLAKPVSLFRRDEPLKDGADHVLRQAGKITGVEVLNEIGQCVRRFGRPLDAVGQRLIKHSMVVDLASFRESDAQLGQNLGGIDVVEVQLGELASQSAQALIEKHLAQQAVDDLPGDGVGKLRIVGGAGDPLLDRPSVISPRKVTLFVSRSSRDAATIGSRAARRRAGG